MYQVTCFKLMLSGKCSSAALKNPKTKRGKWWSYFVWTLMVLHAKDRFLAESFFLSSKRHNKKIIGNNVQHCRPAISLSKTEKHQTLACSGSRWWAPNRAPSVGLPILMSAIIAENLEIISHTRPPLFVHTHFLELLKTVKFVFRPI